MSDDTAGGYYSARERMERTMAEAATNPAVRAVHVDMARRYAERASGDVSSETHPVDDTLSGL